MNYRAAVWYYVGCIRKSPICRYYPDVVFCGYYVFSGMERL